MKHAKILILIFTATAISIAGCGKTDSPEPQTDNSKQESKVKNEEVKDTKSNVNTEEMKKKSIQNLKDAIKGETTASAKYLAYSQKAKEEGFDKIAVLFEAASKSENIHANNHRAVLEQLGGTMEEFKTDFEVNSTKANLEDAIKGESYEVDTMYPEFIKTANDGNVSVAMITFNYAYKTEMKHRVFYQNALTALNEGKANDLAASYYVCQTCGNTYENAAPKRCSISLTSGEKFLTVKI